MSLDRNEVAGAALERVGPLLKDKVVLVVGASRGIGAGIAAGIAQAGATLVIASRDLAATEGIADAIGKHSERPQVLPVDVADAASVAACVDAVAQRYGRLDGAVNNAGRTHPSTLLGDLEEDAYEAVMDVNVRGVFLCMRAQINHMLQGGGGSIVNVASTGSLVGVPTKSLYTATKHAVAGLTRTAALEYASRGIRVNAIAPGATFTHMIATGLASTEEGRRNILAGIPMQRMGSIDEMAGPTIWLLSGLATYVTGTIVPIDGGWTAR